jgi:hypothetical protein
MDVRWDGSIYQSKITHHRWPVITFHSHLIRFHYPHQDGSMQQEEPYEHCKSLKQMSRAMSMQGEQREPELERELSASIP